MVDPQTIIDGRYRVLSRIGSGGMGDVYLVQDQLLGRDVALKILHPRFAEDQEFVERFRREASSAAGLSHPHVVAIFDRGQWDGTYYIAMEYLPGRSLKAIVLEYGAFDPASAIDIVIQILRAASFAHARGIIHRDLKPHNVILDEEGRAKVTDFGIARAGASDMTLTGSIMGTAQYLSPEQAQGHAVSAASDLYAVGIVLYELLTGQIPFDGETAVTIALKQVSAAPPPPSALNPAVTPSLDAVVSRALAKDPAQRFTDADQFIAALEQAKRTLSQPSDTSVLAPSNGGLLLPAGPTRRTTRRGLWIIAGLALLALIVLGGVLLSKASQVTVPNVTGQSQPVATAKLSSVGLKAIPSYVSSPTIGDGLVVSSSPSPGAVVNKGSRVAVLISSGPASTPLRNVSELTSAQAVHKLQAEGFRPVVQSQSSDTIKQGNVISTKPPAGTKLQPASAVTVYVSSGPAQVKVPDVTGQGQAAASAALAAAGLKVGTVTNQPSSSQAPGTVLSQSPHGGTLLAKGEPVNMVVAATPKDATVPNVLNQDEAQAAATLGQAGFTAKSVQQTVTDPTQNGVVLAQHPQPGHKAKRGSTVTITVGVINQTTTPTTPTTTPETTTPVPPSTTPNTTPTPAPGQ